ncbi:MAG: serine hydrolase [Chitinophagaceae bacterium]|nr:MAG: serine hydrolase [Chitinophagaceae bacterium]
MNKFLLTTILFFSIFVVAAQSKENKKALLWVDSVFNSLSEDEKIAQLMVVRAHSNLGVDHVAKLEADIKQYNIGALCFFQGGPLRQAQLTNYYQSIAKTPLLITIDAEWGLGMRLDSVIKFPYQLTLGAMNDAKLMYQMGIAVGEQCRRLGVHVNYAPVVDVNNNPNNPVIGYRSFGEDKYKVATFGTAYSRGMQHAGIMACAKHFPGHGDTETDSHHDLPIINKTREQLDSLELFPFRALLQSGVGGVMVAHLYIPSVDTAVNRATSLSQKNVSELLQTELKFSGLTFTDALEMKGVSKFFPSGEASVQALIAGNDMLCLPGNVAEAVAAIRKAIDEKKLTWADIDRKLKKVLAAKYQLGLQQMHPINTNYLLEELNVKTEAINKKVAQRAITIVRDENNLLLLGSNKKVAYVGIGCTELNEFGKKIRKDFLADTFLFSWKEGIEKATIIVDSISKNGYDVIVVGIHNYNMKLTDNYGMTEVGLAFWKKLNGEKTISFVFGNVYALKKFCEAKSLIAGYQDEKPFHDAAYDLLRGKLRAIGKLPVSVCNSLSVDTVQRFIKITPNILDNKYQIDSILEDALAKKAFPGAVVLVVQNGNIIYQKAVGKMAHNSSQSMSSDAIFDLASVTKISATTISVMKLYEQGKLDITKTLGDYLLWTKGSNKEKLIIKDLLLHQAGLVPFIPFYREVIDTITGIPNPELFSATPNSNYSIRVAENIYLKKSWNDTMLQRILQSPLTENGKYVYSDNGFILLGKIVEAISGMKLDEFVQKNFYSKMGLETTSFKPRKKFEINRIVPTEMEKHFRKQTIQGDVHDEGASMFGGVSGHAGLFSNAYDLSVLYQMLMQGGLWNGERYLQKETIEKFTAYGSPNSRRALGFDKPEKDNATRKDPYPSKGVSLQTFGHTGFTGTCVWVDPEKKLVYIFLSNRVNPTRNNSLLSQLQVRGKIQDAIYKMKSVN